MIVPPALLATDGIRFAIRTEAEILVMVAYGCASAATSLLL